MAITKIKFDCAPTERPVPAKINFIPDIASDTQITEVKWEFKDKAVGGAIATATYSNGSWSTAISGDLASASTVKWGSDGYYTNSHAVDLGSSEGINFGNLYNVRYELGSKPLSISFWMKSSTNTGIDRPILFKGNHGGTGLTGPVFSISLKNGKIYVALNGSEVQEASELVVADGNWHHIVLSIPASTLGATLYIDGVKQNSNLYLGYLTSNTLKQYFLDANQPILCGEGIPMTNPTVITYLDGETTDSTPDADNHGQAYVNSNQFSNTTTIKASLMDSSSSVVYGSYVPYKKWFDQGHNVYLRIDNTTENDWGSFKITSFDFVGNDPLDFNGPAYVDFTVENLASDDNYGQIDSTSDDFTITMYIDGGNTEEEENQVFYEGSIDEVAFFDYFIEESKAKGIYNFGIPYDLTLPPLTGDPLYEDGLLAYFRLNEGTGTTISDSSKYIHPDGEFTTVIGTPSWVSGASTRTPEPYEVAYWYQDQAPSPNSFNPKLTVTDDSGASSTYLLTDNKDEFGNDVKLELALSATADLSVQMASKTFVSPVDYPTFSDASFNDSILSRKDGGGRAFEPLTLGTAGQVLKVNSGANGIEWGTDAGGSDITNDTTWNAAGDIAYATGANAGTVLAAGTSNQFLRINGTSLLPEWANIDIPTLMTDPLWTNAGEMAYATGNNAGAILGIGTAGQVLTVNSTTDAPEWSDIPTQAPGDLIRDADSDTYIDRDAGPVADSDMIEMKANGNLVMTTQGGLALRPTHGTGGYIALGIPCPQIPSIYLTDVTEIGSDYLILNPDDTTNTVPSPGVGKGVAIQWKGKRFLYSYHPNQYGALQELAIHTDETPHEKTFTATQIPTGVTAGKWNPLPLNNFGNSLGSTDSWVGTGPNGVSGPPDAPSPSGAGDQLTVATWHPFHDMICKEFYVEMGGIGNPTDYWVNLMEYDKTVNAQTKRVTVDNGTSLTGNLTVDNVEADHVIQSSLQNNLSISSAKVYILWVGYATQNTAFPNKRVSVKWHYHYTRKA